MFSQRQFAIIWLTDLGYYVNFTISSCIVQDSRTRMQPGSGHGNGGLYELEDMDAKWVATAYDRPIVCSNGMTGQ